VNARNGKAFSDSPAIEPGAVAGALETVLPRVAGRASVVRVELARRLAAQIDDPETAGYVLPKLSAELRAVLVELEDGRPENEAAAARRILAEVVG
jgi:hypothetical protein